MGDTTGRWTMIARAGALVCCALLAACSGGGGGDANGGPDCASSTVSISIEPAAPTVVTNTTQPFVATVTDPNTAVAWSVEEGAVGGTVSNTGVYTAPATPGTYHIVAESQADSCATATVEVTVEQAPPITVSIDPEGPVTIDLQGSQTFLATVTGTTNRVVTWSVQPGGAGGQINQVTGVYTAPTTLPASTIDFVIAASVVNPAASDIVQINIDASTSVLISPSEVTVALGGQVQFSLSESKGDGWSLNGIDDSIGMIHNSLGTYTAPIQMPTSTSAIKASHVSTTDQAVITLASRFLSPETLEVDGCGGCQTDKPNAIVAEDFNGDELDDLATANSRTGTISVLIAADKSHFAEPVRLQVGDPDFGDPEGLAVVDLNFDSTPQSPRVDLIIADADPSGLAVRTRLGVGDGTFGDERGTGLPSPSDPFSIAVGYFDSDPDLDVAVANAGNSTVHILQGVGDGTFTFLRTFGAVDGIANPLSITVADFNRDGFDDLAVANRDGDTVTVFLSNGDGTFNIQSLLLDLGSGPSAVAAATLDGNNYPDLIVTTAQNNQLTVFLNTGDPDPLANPRFSAPDPTGYPISTGAFPVAVATGDFNNDGVPDVVVANQGDDSVTTYLFDPSDDKLVRSETYTAGDAPQALAVGDFNGDGWNDVAVANNNDDTVSVLRNRGGPTAP